MPAYTYTGRDGLGAPVRGFVDAEDERGARARLREQGLFVTTLAPQHRWAPVAWLRRPAGTEDVAAFTFHLAGLVNSGVPLVRGLEVLHEQTESRALREAIADIRSGIGAGQTLSSALGRHPRLFSPLYIGVIRTGEIAGALDQTLLRLTAYLERELDLRRKIRSLLVYPTFVLALAAVVVGLFMVLVIPAFERVYRSAGAALPLPTQVLLDLSGLTRRAWPAGLAGAVAGLWVLNRPAVRAGLRRAVERVTYGIPRLGPLVRTAQVSRFVRAFGTMQASGVPIIQALGVTMEALPDPQMRAAIAYLRDAVVAGRRLSDGMRGVALFPPMLHRMVALGEEAGRLDSMLERAADLLERELDYAIRRFVTLAEPLMTLALGAVVAGILLALYLPIFGLPKAILR